MDKDLREEIIESMDAICFSPSDKKRIVANLTQTKITPIEREGKNMKKWKLPKVAVIAVTVIALTGGVAYAAGTISSTSVGSSIFDYKYTYEKLDKIYDKAGFEGYIIEEFSNGYSFDKAAVLKVNGQDENLNNVKSWNEIDVKYENAQGDEIGLALDESINTGETEDDRTPSSSRDINGIIVKYNEDEYVFLPGNMENNVPEEIKKRAENDEHYIISYGSDEEEHSTFTSINFVKDDVYYLIYGQNTTLSEDDFYSMAEEIINE